MREESVFRIGASKRSAGIPASGIMEVFEKAQRMTGLVRFELGEPDFNTCLLYTSPSPRDRTRSRMPSSA